jgi:hypothetical protein
MSALRSRTAFHNFVTPTLVVVVVCVIYVSGVLINADGDPLAFAVLGTRFSEGDPQGSEGYDGQFAYQIALRPLSAAPYLDVPAYRYQRILYPMLARLLALGRPGLVPWALIVVNVAAIGFGTWATERLLVDLGASRWYALVYGLYAAQLLALRADLNEPLAQALVMWALLAWARERRWLAVVAFGLAVMAKETALIFLAAYMLYTLQRRAWRWTVALGVGAIPFVAYQLLLWSWLGEFGVGSGGAGATPFSLVPLGGWLDIAGANFNAFLLISLIVVPLSVIPAIAGIVLSVRDLSRGESHPFLFCLLLHGIVILLLPNSTFRELAAMVRLTQGLMVSMLLYGALRRSSRVLNYSTLWVVANVLLIKGVA